MQFTSSPLPTEPHLLEVNRTNILIGRAREGGKLLVKITPQQRETIEGHSGRQVIIRRESRDEPIDATIIGFQEKHGQLMAELQLK